MNKLLSLKIPGNDQYIPGPPGFKFANSDSQTSLGFVLSSFLNIVFLIAGFLMFYWLAWGVMQYIFAGGNKDALAKARARITWAITGFIILVISFAVSQYAQTLLPVRENQPVTNLTAP